ncbi:MAG: hypothetical protein GC186_18695 [Rhodobacteraceae bacterium]|nr:hypothetical protein [Paracoccaceae bacterium]
MNFEAYVIRLRQLRDQIKQQIKVVEAYPPKPGTQYRKNVSAAVDDWNNRILAIGKDLKSRAALNELIYQRNRFGPHSYEARQSYESKERNIRILRAALLELAQYVHSLSLLIFDGDPLVKASLEAIKNALKHLNGHVQQGQNAVLSTHPYEQQITAAFSEVRPADPALPGGASIYAGSDLITLIIALFVLIKRWAEEKSREDEKT